MPRRLAAAAAVLLAVLVVGHAAARADAPSAEDMAKLRQRPAVWLVTMGVGELIWERHGHIALCVLEADARDNRCYNYGIGDFGHPLAMGWGFLRATGAFWVDEMSMDGMLQFYARADRTIWVQPLPLNAEQRAQLIAKLEHDIQPANRNYAYDHFWDNCTTRVRDDIDQVTGGALSSMKEPGGDKTFRDLAREGFYGLTMDGVQGPLLITDVAMGRTTDRVPTYYERMFLPQYLREAVTKRWGIQPIAIYTRQGPPQSTDDTSGRLWLALAIVLLTAPAWLARRFRRFQRTGLAIAVVPYVLLGAALMFVAIVSPLSYLRWNELVLVLLPLDLLVLVLRPSARRRYARGRLIMLGAMLVLSLVSVLEQPLLTFLLWPAIPLAVAALWPDPPATGKLGEPSETDPASPTARNRKRS